MKKHFCKLAAAGFAAALSVSLAFPVCAGQWHQKEGGESWQWWYENDDGSYITNDWQLIDGQYYHFDSQGYIDVGWHYIDNVWYHMDDSGVMERNLVFDTGHLGDDGAWVNDRIPMNYHVIDDAEIPFWQQKWEAYGLDSMTKAANADGSETYYLAYDSSKASPDVINVVLSNLLLTSYSEFSYQARIDGDTLTITIWNMGTY